MVRNLIRIQDSYINTYHPDFMGGANSIVNVFDVNNYHKDHLAAMTQQRERADSYDQIQPEEGQEAQRGKFGSDMLISRRGMEDNKGDGPETGRLKNYNEYEIQKYMQKDIKPIHLPDMPTYMRA